MTVKEPQIGKIEDLVLRMKLAKPQGAARPVTFLMGAGCSVSAGIPTVTTIAQNEVLALAANFGATPRNPAEAIVALASHGLFAGHAEIARTKPDTLNWGFIYDTIFKEVHTAPTDVGKLFKRILKEAKPRINWAHLALGELAAKGWISTTITTNFDLLALEGYARAGVIPVVSDGVESLGRIDPRPDHPQLLQINGSMHAYRLRNSDDELKELTKEPAAIACFQNLFQHSDVLVVVGYDGREPHIMRLLTDAARAYPDKHVFWCLYSRNPKYLSLNAQEFLAHSINARLLIDQDADIFFHSLCSGLGIGAPRALRDPLGFAKLRRDAIYEPTTRHAPIIAELATFDVEIQRLQTFNPAFASVPLIAVEPAADPMVRDEPPSLITGAKDRAYAEADGMIAQLNRKHTVGSGEALFDALRKKHRILYKEGRDKGDVHTLQVAIRLSEASVDLAGTTTQRVWALNDLGVALRTFGARQSETGTLRRSIEVFRDALELQDRESSPFDWAMTQSNMGAALRNLGDLDSEKSLLVDAVWAYRAALEVFTRDRIPESWARTQNNLGVALHALGKLEQGTERLEEAVSSFKAALQERTREALPIGWAMTQTNLADSLYLIGDRRREMEYLEEAVSAYRLALEERTRERVPVDWASSSGHLGEALLSVANYRQDRRAAEQALAKLQESELVLRQGGHLSAANQIAAQIPNAQALIARLSGEEAPDSAPQKGNRPVVTALWS